MPAATSTLRAQIYMPAGVNIDFDGGSLGAPQTAESVYPPAPAPQPAASIGGKAHPLTAKQKLIKALASCRKLKRAHKRAVCVAKAKHRYEVATGRGPAKHAKALASCRKRRSAHKRAACVAAINRRRHRRD
jgi:hypothetical protein